jgi:hypothetical protein
MKFSKNLLRGTLARSAATLMLLCAFLLSVCVISYASTKTPISNQAKTSPSVSLKVSKQVSATVGVPFALSRQSTGQANRFTNFTGLKTFQSFGDKSPIKLRLGGPDSTSIKFIGELDHFYFSKFANNTSEPLRNFFTERYFKDGAALFGRESTEELEDFRKAAGEKLKNLTDRQTKLSFRHRFRESEIGRISAVSARQRSNWRGSSPRSTRGQPKSAES